jgi:hypothetical protein
VSPFSIIDITYNTKIIKAVTHSEQSIRKKRKEIEAEFDRMLSDGIFDEVIVSMIIKLRNEVFREEYVW